MNKTYAITLNLTMGEMKLISRAVKIYSRLRGTWLKDRWMDAICRVEL